MKTENFACLGAIFYSTLLLVSGAALTILGSLLLHNEAKNFGRHILIDSANESGIFWAAWRGIGHFLSLGIWGIAGLAIAAFIACLLILRGAFPNPKPPRLA